MSQENNKISPDNQDYQKDDSHENHILNYLDQNIDELDYKNSFSVVSNKAVYIDRERIFHCLNLTDLCNEQLRKKLSESTLDVHYLILFQELIFSYIADINIGGEDKDNVDGALQDGLSYIIDKFNSLDKTVSNSLLANRIKLTIKNYLNKRVDINNVCMFTKLIKMFVSILEEILSK